MSRYVSREIRVKVEERANFRCEYRRIHADDSFLPLQIEHIISLKHGGGSELENLALACPHCNQNKGTDLTTFLEDYQDIVPLYHPRLQVWFDHFKVEDGEIIAKTRIAEATIKLLKLNEAERLIQRSLLMSIGRYP
ncbi:MAG: HNH endonuclease [Bacteroidota bacterium]